MSEEESKGKGCLEEAPGQRSATRTVLVGGAGLIGLMLVAAFVGIWATDGPGLKWEEVEGLFEVLIWLFFAAIGGYGLNAGKATLRDWRGS